MDGTVGRRLERSAEVPRRHPHARAKRRRSQGGQHQVRCPLADCTDNSETLGVLFWRANGSRLAAQHGNVYLRSRGSPLDTGPCCRPSCRSTRVICGHSFRREGDLKARGGRLRAVSAQSAGVICGTRLPDRSSGEVNKCDPRPSAFLGCVAQVAHSCFGAGGSKYVTLRTVEANV